MNDKELIFQAISKYVKGLASGLFHFNSVASQAVITYVVKNVEDKYGKYLDIFIDKNDNINIDLLGNAIKAEMKERYADGFITTILGKPIKFNEDDITQIIDMFKQSKQIK